MTSQSQSPNFLINLPSLQNSLISYLEGEPVPELGQPEDDETGEEEERVADGEPGQQRGEGLADGGLDEDADGHDGADDAEDGDDGEEDALDEEEEAVVDVLLEARLGLVGQVGAGVVVPEAAVVANAEE